MSRAESRQQGLHYRYVVRRVDGRSRKGQKHYGCDYFVLDLDHDPFALWALRAYITACRAEYPQLAADLERKIQTRVIG